MNQAIAQVTLVVKNYDEAIAFYTQKLGFKLVDDIQLDANKRWVTVSPPSLNGLSLLLAEAANDKQKKAIGNQSGGRVFLFLHTDDFWRDYQRMKEQGVKFNENPREEPYGTVVVFKDLYGNLWDLIERK
ncbi:VOC family protein [uncultured Zobellia sp.]|uniref:VOC family protein n=1 Tax=uncultured Zobellia sp. TaxID=255433 RepID=UPI002593356A|nr:VOC family protein [uncultured Zobellia sp.]